MCGSDRRDGKVERRTKTQDQAYSRIALDNCGALLQWSGYDFPHINVKARVENLASIQPGDIGTVMIANTVFDCIYIYICQILA
jgi:hypothetical protein